MKKLLIFAFIVLVFISSISFVIAQDCEEEWVCKDWSNCVDGLKTRTCQDKNNCGTDIYKPFESSPCVEGEEELVKTKTNTANGSMLFIVILIVVLVVAVSAMFLYRRRKK